MYVVIDLDHLVFVAKHPSRDWLNLLSNIEHALISTRLVEIDVQCFGTLSDLELRMLYKNTTGEDHVNAYRHSLIAACIQLAFQLPLTPNLDGFELSLQSRAIMWEDKRAYRYAPGRTVPVLVEDLFAAPEPLKCAPLQAIAGATVPSTPSAPVAGSVPPKPRPAATVTAAPKGGQRTLIWECMDALWEKADKTPDARAVLLLRKQCMDQLEAQHGVKRTSASSELGNWQKARLP